MIEAQARYVMSCLKLMRRRGKPVIEVREQVQRAFNEEVRRRLASTVWQSGGCSWYQDSETGESPVLWPGTVVEYMRRTRMASEADFHLG